MHLNWRRIGIHAAIIFALTALGGLFVAMVGAVRGTMPPVSWLAISNLLTASAGFAYASYQTHHERWSHLGAVAFVLWLISLINPILGFATFLEWLLSIIAIIVFMAVGGAVGALIAKRT